MLKRDGKLVERSWKSREPRLGQSTFTHMYVLMYAGMSGEKLMISAWLQQLPTSHFWPQVTLYHAETVLDLNNDCNTTISVSGARAVFGTWMY